MVNIPQSDIAHRLQVPLIVYLDVVDVGCYTPQAISHASGTDWVDLQSIPAEIQLHIDNHREQGSSTLH